MALALCTAELQPCIMQCRQSLELNYISNSMMSQERHEEWRSTSHGSGIHNECLCQHCSPSPWTEVGMKQKSPETSSQTHRSHANCVALALWGPAQGSMHGLHHATRNATSFLQDNRRRRPLESYACTEELRWIAFPRNPKKAQPTRTQSTAAKAAAEDICAPLSRCSSWRSHSTRALDMSFVSCSVPSSGSRCRISGFWPPLLQLASMGKGCEGLCSSA
jgi:hypothetical protein